MSIDCRICDKSFSMETELTEHLKEIRAHNAALMAALERIAQGNVPPGFLDGLESKAAFNECFSEWMQKEARAAINLAMGE